ncbi:hypothetical protein CTAM01_13845 [Colletotrichum tamarilloi]|uniref:tyrosinase n=1 Tax=Colletotrichum tamarilloi TaxID=1209934 RepID=A0ABQ9QR05_9PEZI|nr:uncharacterized protein CTAM01_13845 [Colletotrichum tamarilloi]KAK1481787.1 hypothetical protein CTAM01_13845 [Colletotrichum tamarilloi]
MSTLRIRKDLATLDQDELDTLIRAFQYIISLKPDDKDDKNAKNSYFTIAGYHGLPAPIYCQHGNVLFPTWHRAYLLRLENALRSAPGCSNLALPYWNEWSNESMEKGLPDLFTQKDYKFKDGTSIPNPLFSYTLQEGVHDLDDQKKDLPDGYTKPKGYETVRYPYSGLVSSDFNTQTSDHNAQVNKLPPGKPTELLNGNVTRWLNLKIFKNYKGEEVNAGIAQNFKECLDAPNYTVFSNANSAQDWNKMRVRRDFDSVVVSVEEPHNSMHLAIGGFDVPNKPEDNVDVYPFANGDMGENDTAAFDPVFFFHHCYIDYMFWKWQNSHNKSKQLDIIPDLKGAKGLTLDTPLDPFTREDITPGDTRPMTSNDVTDTANLGYDYPRPKGHFILPGPEFRKGPKLTATGINRARIRGSFVISTWAKGKNGQPDKLLDTKSVLSRWNTGSCDNCQNYLDIESHRKLWGFSNDEALNTDFFALVHTRDNPEGIDTIEGNKIQADIGTAQ